MVERLQKQAEDDEKTRVTMQAYKELNLDANEDTRELVEKVPIRDRLLGLPFSPSLFDIDFSWSS